MEGKPTRLLFNPKGEKQSDRKSKRLSVVDGDKNADAL